MTNSREIILKCTEVNRKYMRLPAGKVGSFKKLAALYRRIASQGLQCAKAWVKDEACPSHEPAVDAFFWGVVQWAEAFQLSVGVDSIEWRNLFIRPHEQFANYLLPGPHAEPLPFVSGPPADIILGLDVLWMERVIKLTVRWGFAHHLKDSDALKEAQRLGNELRNPHSPAYKAYLKSDLKFFRALFPNFPFSEATRQQLDNWLAKAEEAL